MDTALPKRASWRDYYEMTKPRVVMMMILTAMVGMFLAVPGMVPLDALLWGNVGIALVASAGAVVNHLIDHRIDTIMQRTLKRPIPQGRVTPTQALLFACAICLSGMAILMWLVNPLCAWLTLASFVGYAIIYTGWLKRATPQNIVIGGLSGAMPPLLGWTAVTGTVEDGGLLLVLIIFAWTPPHFWPLAIHRKNDYAKTNIDADIRDDLLALATEKGVEARRDAGIGIDALGEVTGGVAPLNPRLLWLGTLRVRYVERLRLAGRGFHRVLHRQSRRDAGQLARDRPGTHGPYKVAVWS